MVWWNRAWVEKASLAALVSLFILSTSARLSTLFHNTCEHCRCDVMLRPPILEKLEKVRLPKSKKYLKSKTYLQSKGMPVPRQTPAKDILQTKTYSRQRPTPGKDRLQSKTYSSQRHTSMSRTYLQCKDIPSMQGHAKTKTDASHRHTPVKYPETH